MQAKRGLSAEQIVEAAVAVADEEGLEAVSMARVAQRTGFTTMALYRHLDDKAALLWRMLDAALGPPPAELDDFGGRWRAGLEAWAHAVRARVRLRPWVLRVPIAGMPMGSNQLTWLDRGLRALEDTGLAEADKAELILLVNGFVFWDVRLAVEVRGGTPGPAWDDVSFEGLPAFQRALEAGIFDDFDDDPERDAAFRFGLERILDGAERLIEGASS